MFLTVLLKNDKDKKLSEVIGKTIFDFSDENLAVECTKADHAAIQSKMPQRFDQLVMKNRWYTLA